MRRFLILLLCCLLLTGCGTTSAGGPTLPTEPSTQPSLPESPTTTPTIPATEQTIPPTTEPTETTAPSTEPAPTETLPPPTDPPETMPPETDPPETEPPETTPPPPEPVDPMTAFINAMSIEERVGQLFLARCPNKKALSDIQTYHLGGYILFERDFEDETPSSVTKTIASYQAAAKIPMLIAVDEEGGKVNRVSKYPAFRATPFLSPREIYDMGGLAALEQNEEEKSILLSSLGINVNLSPVCDITTDPEAFMYPRSLGQDPETTGRFVQTMLKTMQRNGISGVLKHFPGYGNNTDTHVAIAVDDRSLDELESRDLVPFQMGIDAGCNAIMVSHTFINAIDPTLPATLSPKVNAYLRNEMGFDRVIMTDDLVMQAITDLYGAEDAAVMAVLAGNDILIVTDYKVQYPAVLEAVRDGRITENQINEAVRRILIWKCEVGLLAL